MSDTNRSSPSIILAPTGALLGAIIGGILWAKYINWTGMTAGWVALVIGLLTGLGAVLTSRSRRITIASVAAVFAIMGILLGKYLDVRWNAPSTVGIIEAQPDIPPEYAESIAKMVEASEAGNSTWKLMRMRMEWFDLIYYAVASFVAFRTAYSKRLHQLLFRTA
ncbi:MAG: hypothetical protein OXT74_12840 [Candidatus Poribacteria bacterium]|nr:hypothetical protein [Candidatus Poribacteria bacterium]